MYYENLDDLVFKIEKLVRDNGKILLDTKNINIEEKEGIFNLVTDKDVLVQNNLKKGLLEILPDSNFIGEESYDIEKIKEDGYTFIVDPIDGTNNFARDLKLSTISVALLLNGNNYISVCYNPYIDEMFVSEKGKGAFLNKEQIHVSDRSIKNGIVSIGSSPYYEELRNKGLDILKNLINDIGDFRRSGSAVLDLCNVACGRCELFYELKLQPWDFAAGALIVKEAGGSITDSDFNELKFDRPSSVVATNKIDDIKKYFN